MNRRGFLGSVIAAVVAGPAAVGALLRPRPFRCSAPNCRAPQERGRYCFAHAYGNEARFRTEPWELAEELKDEEFDYWTKYELEKFGGVLGIG